MIVSLLFTSAKLINYQCFLSVLWKLYIFFEEHLYNFEGYRCINITLRYIWLTVKCFIFAGSKFCGFQNYTYSQGFEFAVREFIYTVSWCWVCIIQFSNILRRFEFVCHQQIMNITKITPPRILPTLQYML